MRIALSFISRAITAAVKPTPTKTMSTLGSASAMAVHPGHAPRHISAPAGVLADRHWLAGEGDAVVRIHVQIGGIGARKADHPPPDHVPVAAIERVREKPFDRVGEQRLEELRA